MLQVRPPTNPSRSTINTTTIHSTLLANYFAIVNCHTWNSHSSTSNSSNSRTVHLKTTLPSGRLLNIVGFYGHRLASGPRGLFLGRFQLTLQLSGRIFSFAFAFNLSLPFDRTSCLLRFSTHHFTFFFFDFSIRTIQHHLDTLCSCIYSYMYISHSLFIAYFYVFVVNCAKADENLCGTNRKHLSLRISQS